MITIDGPAGSGKSTTARLVAKRLGFTYLDTGAIYRALTWLALQEKVDTEDAGAMAALAGRLDVRLESRNDRLLVFVSGRDISGEIRSEAVSQHTSRVARHPSVREELVRIQRAMAEKARCVVEGRDIGSVVFPDAPVKIYLDASIDARTRRRHEELKSMGIDITFEQLREEILRRDRQDSARDASPLRIPDGAIVIDTTTISIEEQVDRIVDVYEQRQ